MSKPLVTVVVATRNNRKTLDTCLSSIVNQTYEPIELIVVDRDSTDGTRDIARFYTQNVFSCGPERCAQRNFGASKAQGEFIAMIDSDMELTPHVIQDCVDTMYYHHDTKGIIIPEESFGQGFWAACKHLERSYYHGNDAIEAARFFTKKTFDTVGGYDESLISGEDWDLSARVRKLGNIERVCSVIRHNEGHLKLLYSLRKKFYYARIARAYLSKHKDTGRLLGGGIGVVSRYRLFLSRPKKLLANPLLGIGMLFMKTCEFGFGGIGYLFPKSKRERV
ncbi:MAG TPA: glycosyltransferase family A protein [Candidatus Saccharimonadales bacterium]|nr:glycosyltransferase family A protein [Candidatus Saccharimonadales bacterium]